jgi:hypothetical protein
MASDGNTVLKRVNYFEGQLLAANDFIAEQEYHVAKARLRNRYHFGCGIAGGLEVRLSGRMLRIEPGLAIDCCGREVYVPCAQEMDLPEETQPAFLCLQYREQQSDPVPTAIPDPEGDTTNFTRTIESYELLYESEKPMTGHRYFRKGWAPCGADHSVPLARLVIRRGRPAIRRVRRSTWPI